MLRCSVPWGASVSIIICFILEYCQRQKWFFKILLAPKMVSSEPSSLWLLKGLLSNTVVVWGSLHRQDWQHSWGSLRSAAQGCFWRNRLESVLPQWCPLWGRVQACLCHLACEGCTACTAAVGTMSEPRTRGDSVLCSLPVFMVLGGFSRDHWPIKCCIYVFLKEMFSFFCPQVYLITLVPV